MALQTSGTISLNDIHVEAGGSSGTQASINDSDIRGLIGKSSGVQMAFSEWYGASNLALNTAFNPGNVNANANAEEEFRNVTATFTIYRNGSTSRPSNWLTAIGSTNGDGFQVYVNYSSYSVNSGTGTIFGTFNQWVTMNTNRSWGVTHYGYRNGYTRANFRFRFRPVGGSTQVDKTIQIEAETTD